MIAQFKKATRPPVLALVVLACLAVVALTDAQTTRQPVKFTGNPPADLAALRVWSSTNDELSLSPGISSDGRYLSYTDGETGDLVVRDLFKSKNQRLTKIPPDEKWKQYAEASLISPDGSQVACVWSPRKDPYQLQVMDRDGGRSRVLYQDKGVDDMYLFGWSGDGRELLVEFQRGSGKSAEFDIALVTVADGTRRVIKTEGRNGGDRFALTPDGRLLAYDRQAGTNALVREVFVMRTAGGKEIPLVQGAWDNRVLGWSPDGGQLLFLSNRRGTFDCWTVRVEDGTARGDPELVKANLGPVTPIGITRRGSLYYAEHVSSSEVQVIGLDLAKGSLMGSPRSIASHQGRNRDLHWSLDGKRLVYLSGEHDSTTVCVYTVETGQHQEYSPRIGPLFWPAWAADGKSIRVRTQTGTFQMDLATGNTKPLHLGEFFIFPGMDETIAFRFVMSSPQKILRKDLRTGQESVLRTLATNEAFGGGFGWNLSQDGQFLSAGVWRDPYRVLQVIPAAGGEPRDLLSTTNDTTRGGGWLPGNRELLCSVGKGLSIVSVDGQPARHLPITQNWNEFHLSPDGQQVAFIVSHTKSELWVLENAVPSAGKIKVARAAQ